MGDGEKGGGIRGDRRPAITSDAFLVGDYIEVTGTGSVNFGITGVVKSVGRQRLTVGLDDDNPKGLWVDWRDTGR